MDYKPKRLKAKDYVDGVLSGNRTLLSKAITLVESKLEEDQNLAKEVMASIMPYSGNSVRIGVTGIPGVGKSTFIENFGKNIVEEGHRLAVLTIDPSSDKSSGSILGDKTRMESLSKLPEVYVRPSPSSFFAGGVGEKTREAIFLCEAAGYDVIIVETVGVGQAEALVRQMVDFFLLLLLPGSGDQLQGIKKGIIEFADGLVITKADGDNLIKSKIALQEFKQVVNLLSNRDKGWRPPVKICSSVTKKGLNEIWGMILDYEKNRKINGAWEETRKDQQVYWVKEQTRVLIEKRFFNNPWIKKNIEKYMPLLINGNVLPSEVAEKLLEDFVVYLKKQS
ncbi:methylmalonyl Co-A mutase-associated GTPase MeaB [Echinicola jeungdonensis]|uniref:Methylmalonyl Co-A mutase-associated GTPase MeaB n=1 Tax=Echinicola jeungdonensis TaxID=709343 RepID=A0ABV5J808_9BACT|nr:methylmalonyl Co-A mutase-associated GTPase MeaB [Echinicola jeungdonensis]MDN3669984.1 methylmalonyl Co-A mutase-associated GTPase MeaB [Echinicola jeungdonensis]